MSAKKRVTDTPAQAPIRPPAELRAFLLAAGEGTALAERAQVVRTAIELAKLHGHGDPAAELAASAYLLRAAGDAVAAERGMHDERKRLEGQEIENEIDNEIAARVAPHFEPVPFTEIVDPHRSESSPVCHVIDGEWLRSWESSLLSSDFTPLIDSEGRTLLPVELEARRAAFVADVRDWPYKTENGFRKFLRRWVAGSAAEDPGNRKGGEIERDQKVELYFQRSKEGLTSRNVLDSWKFWRAQQAAVSKWAGTTKKDFSNLLERWVAELPRNQEPAISKADLSAQVRRHFEDAMAGKSSPEHLERWRKFRLRG